MWFSMECVQEANVLRVRARVVWTAEGAALFAVCRCETYAGTTCEKCHFQCQIVIVFVYFLFFETLRSALSAESQSHCVLSGGTQRRALSRHLSEEMEIEIK